MSTCDVWPVIWPCDVSTASPASTGTAVAIATELVDGLTAGMFGTCTVKVRPCRDECYSTWPAGWTAWPTSSWGGAWSTGWADDASWFALVGCGSCVDRTCSCSTLSQVTLPDVATTIVQVKVDGTPLVTGAYRLDDSRRLVRTDGGAWPRCNNLGLDDTVSGTWSVTATFGRDVPTAGQLAVGEMACEVLRAIAGEDCRLPRNVTQLVRQGVTISVPDLTDALNAGQTGLRLVDLFVRSVNPGNVAARARTWSVDHERFRVPGR